MVAALIVVALLIFAAIGYAICRYVWWPDYQRSGRSVAPRGGGRR
ncbi:hypothetical protein DFR74_11569 [Nocardia puris]|uniref:Uncharacterized protein n=1 Tax=Nocardia puris TaxID=208602 RepID=A0A366D5A7_9NOCA|nr:hypothetical protein DFR74_11569 [Nocardia puris]